MAIDPNISKSVSDLEKNKFVESPTRPGMSATEVVAPTSDVYLDGINDRLDLANAELALANLSLDEIEANLGDQADSAATSDTGTFSFIALFKRFLALLRPSAATLTSVVGATTSTAILAANAQRKGFILVNEGNRDAYVAFASTASLTAYTILIPAGGTLISSLPVYTGPISAIWTNTGSTMRVTEF